MVTFTESAIEKVKGYLADHPDKALRIFIKSGGCSGFSYGMGLDAPRENDTLIEMNGFNVVVDPQSASKLDGANIDYVDSMMGAGFKIENPNAVKTCGCGSSFRTNDEEGTPGSCC